MNSDTSGKKKFAFRDIRDNALLLLSGRPPKSLKFVTNNPVSKKLAKLGNKLKGKLSPILKSQAVSLGAKAALGPVGGILAAKLAGKVKLPGGSKLSGAVSTVTSAVAVGSLGVAITKELDPDKIRRPLKEGLSASASAAALPLASTVAASVAQSLVSGAPLASGLPIPVRQFKTASSLVKSPRFFNPQAQQFVLDAKEKEVADKAVSHVVISDVDERLYPQRGLLEDEIMYRLTLLAENVYAPTRDYAVSSGLGNVVILEGFRAENNGISPHEKGEALDITLGDGTYNVAEKCYMLAKWMRDHIIYDQLILCYDASGGGQSWIHVSFSIEGRRRQVLTKTFNDTHVSGLHLYAPPSGTDVETEQNITTGTQLLETLSQRQQRLQPVNLSTEMPQDGVVKIGASTSALNVICELPPAYTGKPGDVNYWEPPTGVSLDEVAIYGQMRLDVLAATGQDMDTEAGRRALGVNCAATGTFDPAYWVEKAQSAERLTDGRWVTGWNGYLLARIKNGYLVGECELANPGDCSNANVIDVKWSSKFEC